MEKKYYIGENRNGINFNDFNFLTEGDEAKIYSYNDEIIKLFTGNNEDYITDRNFFNLLSSTMSNRFVTPNEYVYIRKYLLHFIKGYTMNYIKGEINSGNIVDVDLPKIISELDLIKEDCKLFANNHIKFNNMYIQNLLLTETGEMYFIDTDTYKYEPDVKHNDLYNKNKRKINYLMIYRYLIKLLNIEKNISNATRIDEIIQDELNHDNPYISTFFKEMEFKNSDDITKYFRSKLKK